MPENTKYLRLDIHAPEEEAEIKENPIFVLGDHKGLPEKEVWLLIRRTLGDKSEYSYFISNAPESCRLGFLVWLSSVRWAIEQCFEETKTELDVEEDGRVFISGKNAEDVKNAQQMVQYYTADIEVGKTYTGKVVKITDFGCFVEVLPGKEGLVHISRLSDRRVNKVTDVVKEGDTITVKAVEIDEKGRLVLSRKDAMK
jgi:hypothetical protein